MMETHPGGEKSSTALEFENATPASMTIDGGDSPKVHNFPGVFVSDYNNDRRPDVLVLTGGGLTLFENVEGGFERSSGLPPLNVTPWSAAFFDYDQDGWDDLLVLPRRDNPVLLMNRNGSFEPRQTIDPATDVPLGAAVNDFDRDGDPDVFVIQYGDWTEHPPSGYLSLEASEESDNGFDNRLYENTHQGLRLVNHSGIEGSHWSLATSFVDFTGDQRPDIHVANDFYNDVFYTNRGNGTFSRTVLSEATNRNAMSSEVADVNEDGHLDIFVTNIYLPYSRANLTPRQYMYVKQFHQFLLKGKRIKGNNLLINRGNGSFTDKGGTYGIRKGGWGWAAIIEDFDGDMDDDLFHTTQITVQNTGFPYDTPMVWERTDSGFEKRNASRIGFASRSGWGTARLDYDLDGDMDVIVATKAGPILYENTGNDANGLEILVATVGNQSPVIGAEISVTIGNTTQFEVQTSGSDFQSQDSRYRYFGADGNETVDTLEVVWPDGTKREYTDIHTNQRIVITRDGVSRTNLSA